MPPRYVVFLLLLCCAVFGGVAFHRLHAAQANPRVVRIAPAGGPIGGMVSVPIELVSQGDENAIGFSLTFNAAVLSNPQAALGADAMGAALNTNAGQAAQGRFGVALAFPANQKFAAGVRQMVVITFAISPGAAFGTTPVGFGDQPVLRELSDVNANAVTADFAAGAVTITKGYEADVSPRPDGDNNGTITVTDWVQIGKFVAGVDTAATGNEFQRADCAPRDTLGDGRISITDWTQAGRYSAGLDPVVPAGGPTAPIIQSSLENKHRKVSGGPSSTLRGILSPPQTYGGSQQLILEVDAQGMENAFGFSLTFNAARWRLVSAEAGADVREAILHVNAGQSSGGRIGLALALPPGRTLPAGARQLVVCEFAPLAGTAALPLAVGFGDLPVLREIADAEANPVSAGYVLQGAAADALAFQSIPRRHSVDTSALGFNLTLVHAARVR